MRKAFYIVSIFFCLNVCAQEPDPNLFQTWYLTFVQASDLGIPYVVSEIDPAIAPFLTISENYEFSGQGACNSFNGIYDFPFDDTFQVTEFSHTGNVCTPPIHQAFESEYFGFIGNGGWFEISEDNDGFVLEMYNAIFGYANFTNYPLSNEDFMSKTIQIYPNPVGMELFFITDNIVISDIEIYSTLGTFIRNSTLDNGAIDVSELNQGLYILRIKTDLGFIYKKILKE